jgi:hypothetical protein
MHLTNFEEKRLSVRRLRLKNFVDQIILCLNKNKPNPITFGMNKSFLATLSLSEHQIFLGLLYMGVPLRILSTSTCD